MIRKSGQRFSEKIMGKQTAEVAVNIRNAARGADETGETSSRNVCIGAESFERGLIEASRWRTPPP